MLVARRDVLLLLLGSSSLFACRSKPRAAGPVRVAAAANVKDVLARIGQAYRTKSGVGVELSAGSSGALYAQIKNGAPFDLFLSADQARPARLEADGLALDDSRFTYAFGRLALVGSGLLHPEDGTKDLIAGAYRKLSIANPETAPYGVAALQVLKKLGVAAQAEGRLVRGENVAQALQFVDTGAAELGLVALSNVMARGTMSYWRVPDELHEPIRQDAVILKSANDLTAARDFAAFLRGDTARELFRAAGYDVPAESAGR